MRSVPFGQPTAQYAVGVLVRGPLPRGVRVAEVDREPVDEGFGVGPIGHLAALVPGERRSQVSGDPIEQLDERGGDLGCAVAFRKIGEQRVAARPAGEGPDRPRPQRPDRSAGIPS